MAESPYTRLLEGIDWQLFVTLTFSRDGRSETCRERLYSKWMHIAFNVCKVPSKEVLWCRRTELGEAGGRLHYHALIARLPPQTNLRNLSFFLNGVWRGIEGGRAECREYNRQLTGVDYVLKGVSGEDFYETGKFGGKRVDVVLSGCLRNMGRRVLATPEIVTTSEPVAAVA